MFSAFRRLSLFLVGFSLPMQGYSLLNFSFGMTPFKIATAILLVVGLAQFAISSRRFPRDRKRGWVIAYLISFLIACVAGVLAGSSFAEVLIVASTNVSLVLYYFLIGYVVVSRRDLVLLLWSLLLGGAVTAAPAFLGLQQGADLGYGERYTGLAGQENLLGFDMAVCLGVGAALLFSTRSWLRRGLAIGLSISCTTGLLLSLSRSAFVSFAGMSAFWFLRAGLARSAKYIVPVGALVLGLALFAPESVVERSTSMLSSGQRAEDGSIQSRLGQYNFALRAIASSPLVGLGVLRFIPWVNQQHEQGSRFHYEVHNAYLGVAVEQGLLGMFLYVGILVLTWSDYSRCIREVRSRQRLRDPSLAEYYHLATFLQIALLGALIGGMFHMAQKSKTIWLLLAISPVLLSLCRARILELEPQLREESVPDLMNYRGGAGVPSRSISPGRAAGR